LAAEGRGKGVDLSLDEYHHVWQHVLAAEVKLIEARTPSGSGVGHGLDPRHV
jgi:hypothetical protein